MSTERKAPEGAMARPPGIWEENREGIRITSGVLSGWMVHSVPEFEGQRSSVIVAFTCYDDLMRWLAASPPHVEHVPA